MNEIKERNLKINCMENILTVVKFTRDYTSLSVQYVLFNATDGGNKIKNKNVYPLNHAHGKTWV